jgi:8-oxo-dGTP pyrophosphatase MutT (NUDIX family)
LKFCSECAQPVEVRVPPGDTLPRYVCTACGLVHYENPKLILGCVPEHDGRLLLCKRAIEPRLGFWTFPAGFMENGETLQQAAARECREEANAEVVVGSLLSVVHVLHAHQVHVNFRATLANPEFGVGSESLQTLLVRPEDIPWGQLAFPSVDFTLRHWLQDRHAGVENHHYTTFDRRTALPAAMAK